MASSIIFCKLREIRVKPNNIPSRIRKKISSNNPKSNDRTASGMTK